MGLYARLRNVSLDCPRCGKSCTTTWQFCFGHVSDLPEYELGDTIRWGKGKRFGNPAMTEVHAVAYPEADYLCSACREEVLAEVTISGNTIVGIRFLGYCAHKTELFYLGHDREPYYLDERSRDGVSNIPQGERKR